MNDSEAADMLIARFNQAIEERAEITTRIHRIVVEAREAGVRLPLSDSHRRRIEKEAGLPPRTPGPKRRPEQKTP